MNAEERAVRYRVALGGNGRDEEVALARILADLPSGVSAEDAWEGALLSEVPPWKLQAIVTAGDWPAVVALAGVAGEDSWSKVVRYNRAAWTEVDPPKPGSPGG